MKKNDELIVDIIDNGMDGEGIAKVDGFAIFIPGAIAGEKVKIKVVKVLKSHGFGKLLEIIEASKHRREIDCETFPRCGGCDLRHMDYDYTLEMKKNKVENLFKKEKIDVVVKPCIGMDNPVFYRNKLQYPFGTDKDGNPVMGVFAKRSHDVIKTEECMIQDKLCQRIAESVFTFVKNNKISIYSEENLKGFIRHCIIRIGKKSNEVMVTIVTTKGEFKQKDEFVNELTNKYPEIKTIVRNINNKNTNVILGRENEVLYGSGYIKDNLLGYDFEISPMSFYQVNPIQTEKLYSKAIEYAELTEKESIFDLYCGIGTIGICASKGAKMLYGIETVPEAIEDAKKNAKLNGVENSKFFVGNVEDVLPELVDKEGIKADVVFIDPPRKGCERVVLETLLKVKPEKIVYVSCNPATLVRDVKMLLDEYDIKKVTPVDMFPYTSHTESIAILKLK